MNAHLSKLVELQDLDKKISSFIPEIEKIEAPLSSFRKEEKELNLNVENLEEEIKDIKLKVKQSNTHLIELADKIEEIKKKTALVKTQKEAKALNLEDELAREQITFTNEEIDRLEKLQENKKETLKEFKETLKEMSSKVEEINGTIESKIADVNKSKTSMVKKRVKLIKTIDEKIFEFYDKIQVWAENTTVVPVKKQACYGCYMRITDNAYNDLIIKDEINTCPHCGRIIYIQQEEV